MDGFFGELYLRTTLPFLDEHRTAQEVRFLAAALEEVSGPIVDLGCGHGRHAGRLSRALDRSVIGLELDPSSLAQREPGFLAVRADLRRLPFRPASLGAIYAWYSTLFVFTDDEHRALLQGIAAALRPGGVLIFQTVPYERLLEAPAAAFTQTLPDGSVIREESRFDPATGRDHGHRRLELPEGEVLQAHYAIRYHRLPELTGLLEAAGLHVQTVWGGADASPLDPAARELIVLARR